MIPPRRFFAVTILVSFAMVVLSWSDSRPNEDWSRVGNDSGGMRYSTLKQINKGNVGRLKVAWTYHTGDAGGGNSTTIECTPIVVDGVMYVTTVRGTVVALDPANGKEIWKYTPGRSRYAAAGPVSGGVNRGVAYWSDGRERRILLGTADGQVISLDAKTGKPDPAFGQGGAIELRDGLERTDFRDLGMTSPPAIYKDLIICGNTVTEGARPGGPGDIRAFDVRTGRQVWRFHTVPRPGEVGHETWPEDGWQDRGGCNAWGGLTVDEKRGIVFGGLGSAAYDWYGGDRAGDNLFGNCTLALDANTGKRLWHFQCVRHDIWDMDLPCPPVLASIKRGGKTVDVAAQVTKSGFCFIFDRVTGKPIFGVEDRAAPTDGVPGEHPSPTQPFPLKPPPLVPINITESDITARTPEAHDDALRRFRDLRSEGVFTPGSEQGSLHTPAWHGGSTWSGASCDPTTGSLYVNSNNTPMVVTIRKTGPNAPTPYGLAGTQKTPGRTERFHNDFHFADKDGYPGVKPPWGILNAIDLNTGDFAWQVPLGEYPELTRAGVPRTGTESFGGTIVTAGGLVFIGGTMDERLHAFDKDSGKLLWEAELPAGGYATPSTYTANGRQYVVIACGGGGKLGTLSGDTFVAYALPDSRDSTANARAELEAAYSRIGEAFAHRDAAGMARWWAPDFTATQPGGRVMNRAAVEADFGRQMNSLAHVTWPRMIESIRLEGDTAHLEVNGKLHGEMRGPGGIPILFAFHARSHDTWKRSNDGWRIARTDLLEARMSLDGKPVELSGGR